MRACISLLPTLLRVSKVAPTLHSSPRHTAEVRHIHITPRGPEVCSFIHPTECNIRYYLNYSVRKRQTTSHETGEINREDYDNETGTNYDCESHAANDLRKGYERTFYPGVPKYVLAGEHVALSSALCEVIGIEMLVGWYVERALNSVF